jgi:hypothetical protein
MGRKEKELLAVLKQLGYKVTFVPPGDPYLKGAGGWHSSFEKEIAIGDYDNGGKVTKMVLWHEATHAAQYCYAYGLRFDVLGFKPTEEGQEDWLKDKSWYQIVSYDIEREARYVQFSERNQDILLSVLYWLANDRKKGDYVNPSMVSLLSQVEYKKAPPKMFDKLNVLMCCGVILMGILAPTTPISTFTCTYMQVDSGDCD